MITSRRALITGLVSLVAAPAIVRASSLMPVKSLAPVLLGIDQGWSTNHYVTQSYPGGFSIKLDTTIYYMEDGSIKVVHHN